jgi:hypothetical protein
MAHIHTLTVLAVAACCVTSTAIAQGLPDRGALLLRLGTDTLVTDRFVRTPNALRGSVLIKGQGRVDYLAMLGPDDAVRSLSMAIFAASAGPGAPPLQQLRLIVLGDSAIAETPSGIQRLATKVGAIPMFNNALALTELFTRRARAQGGVADIPYLATNGGATLNITVRPAGTDSLIVTIAKQVQRLRVDARGRIAGGTITGTAYEYLRAGPEAAEGSINTLRDSTVAPKTDYSAPRGAPYTAEEVRVPGPGGIMLAGTLTLPTDARGPFPAVVTITGSGQQDRDEFIPFAGGIRMFRQIADTLSRRGIAVLRLDDRGTGASGGDAREGTSADFADDTRAAVAYLRTRKEIDGARLALVGHSEGGAIAPMLAATDARLRAIVVMAGPGEPGIEISMAQNKFILDRDTTLTPARRDSLLRAARASLNPAKQTVPWLKFWMGYDPAPIAREVKAATLILQGATDRQVPVDQANKLAALIRAGGNTDVTVRVIPATNHLFIVDPSGDFGNYDKLATNRLSADVLGPLADWLVLKLARRAQ